MNPSISFDPDKSQRNELERGLSFTWVQEMEWGTSLIKEDTRKDYGERRFLAMGKIQGRLHAVVFTPRNDKVHVISLRKANAREIQHYEHTQNSAQANRHG